MTLTLGITPLTQASQWTMIMTVLFQLKAGGGESNDLATSSELHLSLNHSSECRFCIGHRLEDSSA